MTDEEIFDAYGQDVIVWFHTTHEEVRVTQVRQGDEGPQEDRAELFLKAVISTYHILNTFFNSLMDLQDHGAFPTRYPRELTILIHNLFQICRPTGRLDPKILDEKELRKKFLKDVKPWRERELICNPDALNEQQKN
ncbi:MAG: hypothetical protein MK098_08810 [Marinovum sp.]|nr:hypothetical protein [Marinovum sp.]